MKGAGDQMPPRLADGEGEVAELLRKVERQARQAPSETAAWERTLRRLGRDSGRVRLRVGLAAAAGAVVGAVALYATLSRTAQLRTTPASGEAPPATVARGTRPAPGPTNPIAAQDGAGGVRPAAQKKQEDQQAPEAPEVPRIQLGRAGVGLPAGRAELLGEADVTLSRGGSARAFATAAAATVDLEAGEVELHVEKRPAAAGHVFEVVAGGYRFTVLGTTFRVARANDDVTLSVTEGRVAVSQGAERLTVVTAGGFWAGASRRGPLAVAPAARRTGSPTTPLRAERVAGTSRSAPMSVAEAASRSRSTTVAASASTAVTDGMLTPPPFVAPSSSLTAGPARPSQPAFEPALAPRAAASPSSAPRSIGSGAGASASAVALMPAAATPAAGRLAPPPVAGAAPRTSAPPMPFTPSPRAASTLAQPGCAARASGAAPKARLECLLGEARGSDLGAEVALYEAARLYRDALGDTGHAIATLRELRRRFPSGALAAEAELSLAEMLPAVGRYREALAETAAVLGSHPTPERADELHLLRGDLLRKGLGDCRAAAAEYAQATEVARDGVADPASFFGAVCLQKLGDTAGARRAFERYLARPSPRRAAEAARRLSELERHGS